MKLALVVFLYATLHYHWCAQARIQAHCNLHCVVEYPGQIPARFQSIQAGF